MATSNGFIATIFCNWTIELGIPFLKYPTPLLLF